MLLPQSIAANLKNQQSNGYFIINKFSSLLNISLEEKHEHGSCSLNMGVMESPRAWALGQDSEGHLG